MRYLPQHPRLGALIAVLALLSLLPATTLFAQNGPPGPPDPEVMKARHEEQKTALLEKLALADDVQPQVVAILDARFEKQRAFFEKMRSGEVERGSMREHMQALREETETQLAEILTGEQMDTYRAFMDAQRPGGRPGNRPGAGPRSGSAF